MQKTIKIPVYDQLLHIDDSYPEDAPEYAIVESAPLTLYYCKKYWCLKYLAHECIHIVDYLFSNCGIMIPNLDNDEYVSYLYATVFDMVLKATKKDVKEFRKKRK